MTACAILTRSGHRRDVSATGFFGRLKGAISGGINTLRLKSDIREHEKAIVQLEESISQESKRALDRLIAHIAEAGGDGELRRHMRASEAITGQLAAVRPLLRRAIDSLDDAANTQADACDVGDDHSLALEAQDKSEEAVDALGALGEALAGIATDPVFAENLADTAEALQELVKNTTCLNRSGGGRWLNDESAQFMRQASADLAGLQSALAEMESGIAARAEALSQTALRQACEADPEIGTLYESFRRWLPPGCVREPAS